MKLSHLSFLSLYALQVANSAPIFEELQAGSVLALAKRSFFSSLGSHISSLFSSHKSGSTSTSHTTTSSSSDEGSEPAVVHTTVAAAKATPSHSLSASQASVTLASLNTASVSHATDATHSAPSATTTHSSSSATITHSASTTSSVDVSEQEATSSKTSSAEAASKTEEEKEEKESKVKKYGKMVGELVMEGAAGVLVSSNIGSWLFSGGSDDDSSSSSADSSNATQTGNVDVVAFVTTDSTGATETVTVTAPASDFTTGTDSAIYIKTDAYSDVMYYATASASIL